GKSNNNFAVAA
ncbi:tmRNA tag peptide, partial [Staphylococcus lugdunensis HKU09-01]